jgi:formylglycine-generating enzyme required for sulfatase activity
MLGSVGLGFSHQGDRLVQDMVGARSVETKTRVFISYSRKDMAFADELEAALKARDFEVLIDREEIYAFEDWWKRIEALIGSADTVVFALSPDAVQSDVALKEVARAASLNKRFAPIVCRRVEDSGVPEALRRLNFIFFDDPAQFEVSVDKLTEALRTDIGWIRRHTEFGQAARRWVEEGGADGLLLRPPVLEQAETWLALRPANAPPPTAETESFVAESRRTDTERKAAEARSKLRWRRAQVAIYALLVAIILVLVGVVEQDYVKAEWRWWTVTRPYATAQVWPWVLSAARERGLKPGEVFKECLTDCPEMIVVPAGSFTMGSPKTERAHERDGAGEDPQHSVTIAKPFAVSEFELTFADWDACVAAGGCNGYKPLDEGTGRGNKPVVNVNWEDAQQYVAWLSAVTGKTYRLLSEAEYEYATRAGTQTAYPWGNGIKLKDAAMANCYGCGDQWGGYQTAPVGSFAPNRFGLYDMVGNVWEWTEDCWHGYYYGAPPDGSPWMKDGNCDGHVNRGGAWNNSPDSIRSAVRVANSSGNRSGTLGFRVARTLLSP